MEQDYAAAREREKKLRRETRPMPTLPDLKLGSQKQRQPEREPPQWLRQIMRGNARRKELMALLAGDGEDFHTKLQELLGPDEYAEFNQDTVAYSRRLNREWYGVKWALEQERLYQQPPTAEVQIGVSGPTAELIRKNPNEVIVYCCDGIDEWLVEKGTAQLKAA
jgi:hypothetical protein